MIDFRIILFLILLLFQIFNNKEGLPQPILDGSNIEYNMEFKSTQNNNKIDKKNKNKIYNMIDEIDNNIEKFNKKLNFYDNKYCGEESQCITCPIPSPPKNAQIDYDNCGINGITSLNTKCQFKCNQNYRESNKIIGKCQINSLSSPNNNYNNDNTMFKGENMGIFNPNPSINCIPN